jgi:hypothetical protein
VCAVEAGPNEVVDVGVMAGEHSGEPHQRVVGINGRDAIHKCIPLLVRATVVR